MVVESRCSLVESRGPIASRTSNARNLTSSRKSKYSSEEGARWRTVNTNHINTDVIQTWDFNLQVTIINAKELTVRRDKLFPTEEQQTRMFHVPQKSWRHTSTGTFRNIMTMISYNVLEPYHVEIKPEELISGRSFWMDDNPSNAYRYGTGWNPLPNVNGLIKSLILYTSSFHCLIVIFWKRYLPRTQMLDPMLPETPKSVFQ